MKFFNLKIICILILGLIALMLTSCMGARTLMMTADKRPSDQAILPEISFSSVEQWESRKPEIWKTLQEEIYGYLPKDKPSKKVSSRSIDNEHLNAGITEITLESHYIVDLENTTAAKSNIEFNVVIITPNITNGPIPIIMMENFCPNHEVIPLKAISKPKGDYYSCIGKWNMSKVIGFFFGRYIKTPPIQMILDNGYGLAVIYPPETFPDTSERIDIYNKAPNKGSRWGAIGAWAWQFSVLSNYLDQDGRFSATIAYGHSRYGKSALLAAAYDTSIDAVIAHQSGTGGASLSKDKAGESVSSITSQYPHWFTPGYAEDKLSFDQHYLLSLIAPRPILLGNAKRDVWSDPEGAFRAAQGASPIYNLYGSKGLEQTRLDKFNLTADIAFWMRYGTHGVVKEDWPAFLHFLEAHF